MAKIWHLFQEGGIFNWLLLLLFGAGSVGTLALAVVIFKWKRAGAWLFWIAPLLIASAAWMGIAYYGYKVDGALASGGIDAGTASRIRAAGASESLSLLVFGAGYVVLLLAAATVLVGVRALGHQKGRFGAGAILALLGAIGLGGISLFARPFVISKLGGWLGFDPGLAPLLSVPCWFATAIGATCVGAALSSAERDPEHDGLAMGDALAAFTAAALAMSAVVACEYVSDWRIVLGALSGESVDALQKARIFAQGGEEARAALIGNSLLLLPVLGAFAGALVVRLGALGRGLRRAWPTLVAAVILFLALAALPVVKVGNAAASVGVGAR